jgi:phosphatidylglycerol:prolipoprotein diacylglycerol transferase
VHPLLFHLGPFLVPTYGVSVAVGVLLALLCALWSARRLGLNGNTVWNLGVLVVFVSLVASRLLLVLLNFQGLSKSPLWLFGLAMIPNSSVATLGISVGILAGFVYARRAQLPVLPLLDCLAPSLAFGYALESLGCFAAGCAYGVPSEVAWAVTYHSRLAAAWSGTPLGISLHPVQLYEALTEIFLALFLLWWMPKRKQEGELAGLWFFGAGLFHFLCELFRGDPGRAELFGGAMTATQLLMVAMVLAGGLLLRKRDTVKPSPHVTANSI